MRSCIPAYMHNERAPGSPWSLIEAAAALTLAVVVLRRKSYATSSKVTVYGTR